MKRMARIAQTVGLAVGGTMGLAGMGMMRWYRRALPQTSGTLLLPGLRQSVQVLRDRWGIPHIYAEHNADLFRALGYVHAQDRLWQMELNRRTGQGRLAEIFGERLLATDRFIRTLGFNRLALGDVALLDESTYEVVHAYVGGINAYIEQHMKRLPLEFTLLGVQPGPWDLSDVVVWGRVMALNLSVNWKTELLNARLVDLLGAEQARSFMQQYIHEEPITVPAGICYGLLKGDEALRAMREAVPLLAPEQAGQGSNAWVLGGERTAEGKPLLANDTHLLLSMPCSWYEAHLEGGDYRMVGATLPGLPTVLIGHNERITWGITNALIDVQDLFIERFDPANPRRYAWQDGWREADVLEEEIMVRGGVQPVRHHVRITHHGPVITPAITPGPSPHLGEGSLRPTEISEDLSLCWTGLRPGKMLQAGLTLNRAMNWADFREALAGWLTPVSNFLYADVDGHHGYALGGDVPRRKQGDGRLPVPGWTGEYDWDGLIPAIELPAALDPPEAVIVSANHRIAGEAYRHHQHVSGEWLNGYRAARAHEVLAATDRHTVTTLAHMQLDVFCQPGFELARLVADLVLPQDDRLLLQAQQVLADWDGWLQPQSVAACIYTMLRYHIKQRLFTHLDDLLYAAAGSGLFTTPVASLYFDFRLMPGLLTQLQQSADRSIVLPQPGSPEASDTLLLATCFAEAIGDLQQRFGDQIENWQYSQLHTLTLRHPLGRNALLERIFNRGPWPTGGDMDTICMGYTPFDLEQLQLYTGPAYRQICDPGNWNASVSVIAGGQSGHPASPHYDDMMGMWRRGDYHPMLWQRSQVEQHMIATLTFCPDSVTMQKR